MKIGRSDSGLKARLKVGLKNSVEKWGRKIESKIGLTKLGWSMGLKRCIWGESISYDFICYDVIWCEMIWYGPELYIGPAGDQSDWSLHICFHRVTSLFYRSDSSNHHIQKMRCFIRNNSFRMLSCALEDSGVPEQNCTEREGGEKRLERRDSLLNAFRRVKLKNAIFFVQDGNWALWRKPHENRTKTVRKP